MHSVNVAYFLQLSGIKKVESFEKLFYFTNARKIIWCISSAGNLPI